MENKKVSKYDLQAEQFLKETETSFKAEYVEHGLYFDNDKETRDIYKITLTRKDKKPFIFRFGQSIVNSGTITDNKVYSDSFLRDGRMITTKKSDYKQKRTAPSAYDVLACLTKYDVGSLEDFCSEFGYDSDSRTAEKIYLAVVREYNEVKRLWSETEIEKLAEIQ